MIWLVATVIVVLIPGLYVVACDLAPGPRWWTRPCDALMRRFTEIDQ